MNRTELIENVSKETGFTKKDLKIVFDAMYDIVVRTFKMEPVTVLPGCSIHVGEQSERLCHNPKNPEQKIVVPAHLVPKAHFTTRWKELAYNK